MSVKNGGLDTRASLASNEQKPTNQEGSSFVLIRFEISVKSALLLGMVIGLAILRWELWDSALKHGEVIFRGYEYDSDRDCVKLYKKNGQFDYCRPLVNCQMCENVTHIHEIPNDEMDPDIFENVYAFTGQPLIVRNVTQDWKAMTAFDFKFFMEIYDRLNSPVLYNSEPDCQFFSWDFSEFSSMDEVFSMPRGRYEMKGTYTPWYIGWADCDPQARAILRDYYETPWFIPKESESGRRDWFFMGTPGFGAPFHIDNVVHASWQAQIRGRKLWQLKPPPECARICPGPMETILEPGDVIVVNTNWWYHSTSVLDGLSITITNEYT